MNYKGRENKPPSRKRQIILWGGLFFITILLNSAARLMPGFAEWYAVWIYPLLVGSLGRICSLLPFSLSELLLFGGIFAIVVWLIGMVVRTCQKKCGRKSWLKGASVAIRIAVLLFFVFTINCGINYHRLTFSERAGFHMVESTKEELAALCRDLTEELNEAAVLITTDNNGACQVQGNLEERAREAMKAAANTYPELEGYYPNAKPLVNSWFLSYQQLQGIYSPFTIESNYNREMPAYSKPSTICHELSHLKGFMREDEANFVAYLACRASKEADFRYSGSMLAYVYSMNALYREDQELYWQIRGDLCEQANWDLWLYNEFWSAYEGPVAEVSDQLNDTYLKVNAQEDGTKSYGRMVDLLLALRRTSNVTD